MVNFKKEALREVEGDTFDWTISVKNKDGDAKDITGWTFYVTVKNNFDDDDVDAVLSADITNHDNPVGGETSFSFSPSETSGLSDGAGQYFFDLKYEDTSGTVQTIIQRRLVFDETVRKTT